MPELPDVPSLRVLEPPAGGLEALRDKLDRRTSPRWLFAMSALALAIVIIVVVVRGRTRTAAPAAPTPATIVRDRSIGVTFYWASSTPRVPRSARSAVISIDDAPRVQAYAQP